MNGFMIEFLQDFDNALMLFGMIKMYLCKYVRIYVCMYVWRRSL